MKLKLSLVKMGCVLAVILRAARAAIDLPWMPPSTVEEPRTSAASESLPEVAERGVLELKSGERITVQVEAFDPETGVLSARHSMIRGPLAVEAAGLLRYSVPLEPFNDSIFPKGFLVLNNGDRFRASNLSMDASALRFHSPYLGIISIPREGVREWSTHSGLELLYAGPALGEVWRSAERLVRVESPALLLEKNERLGMTLPLWPRRCRVDFTVLGAPQHEVSAFFYARENDTPSELTGSAYRFSLRGTFNDQQAVLSRLTPSRGWIEIGSAKTPFGGNWNDYSLGASISLYFDLTDRPRIVMRVRGSTVAEWRDPNPFPASGRTLAFSAAAPTAIARITLYEWDGQHRSMEERQASIGTDEVLTNAGDRLSGDILSISSGQIRLRTQLGEISIPFEQVHVCRFRSPSPASQPPRMELTRIRLLDGSAFCLADLAIREGTVRGRHVWAGALHMPLRAASMIQWRLDQSGSSDEETEKSTNESGLRDTDKDNH